MPSSIEPEVERTAAQPGPHRVGQLDGFVVEDQAGGHRELRAAASVMARTSGSQRAKPMSADHRARNPSTGRDAAASS